MHLERNICVCSQFNPFIFIFHFFFFSLSSFPFFFFFYKGICGTRAFFCPYFLDDPLAVHKVLTRFVAIFYLLLRTFFYNFSLGAAPIKRKFQFLLFIVVVPAPTAQKVKFTRESESRKSNSRVRETSSPAH